MSLADLDLRWLTAISQMLIGLSIIAWAQRIYWMDPIRRATLFAHIFKEEGVRTFMSALPAISVLGVFLFFAGISKGVFYARWHGTAGTEFANVVGGLEAIFSIWAAGSVMLMTVRAWRQS